MSRLASGSRCVFADAMHGRIEGSAGRGARAVRRPLGACLETGTCGRAVATTGQRFHWSVLLSILCVLREVATLDNLLR